MRCAAVGAAWPVVYDLTTSRQLARYDEAMKRLPDMVGLLLLLGPLVWWVGRYVTKPLARLDQAALALRHGQWQTAIPLGGFAEIDHLATAFDSAARLGGTWQAMPDLMFEMDAQGTYLRVMASRPELLTEGTTPEDLLGKRVGDILPVTAARVVLQALQDAGETGACGANCGSMCLPGNAGLRSRWPAKPGWLVGCRPFWSCRAM